MIKENELDVSRISPISIFIQVQRNDKFLCFNIAQEVQRIVCYDAYVADQRMWYSVLNYAISHFMNVHVTLPLLPCSNPLTTPLAPLTNPRWTSRFLANMTYSIKSAPVNTCTTTMTVYLKCSSSKELGSKRGADHTNLILQA